MSAETVISRQAYQYLAELVYRFSRIVLGANKQQLVTSRLRKRLLQLHLRSFDQYCDLLRTRKNDEEVALIIDLISTNHTHFFRERAHFDFLTQHALPEFQRRLQASGETLRCWSAASSSGEEVYTLAIVLEEFHRRNGPLRWEIHGTDISSRMLERGQQAIYEQSRLELPSSDLLHRYFQNGSGRYEGHCRIKDSLKQRVKFKRVNLFQSSYPVPGDQHLIFCRNVLIYFDAPSQEEVIRRLGGQLAPGGYLFVGHSESLMGMNHRLRSLGQGIFMKPR
jgi:chemotaxis protein methyltransferase CheR